MRVLSRSNGNKDYTQAVILELEVPKEFFGITSSIRARKKAERLAVELLDLVSTLRKEGNTDGIRIEDGESFFALFDLRHSACVDVDFLDALIQEILKRDTVRGEDESPVLNQVILANVPIDKIYRLQQRNCVAFLRACNQMLILLDPLDRPHFLGVPETTRSLFGVREALHAILTCKRISGPKLWKILKWQSSPKGEVALHQQLLATYCEDHKAGLFYVESVGARLCYCAAPLLDALDAWWHSRILDRAADFPALKAATGIHFNLLCGREVDMIADVSALYANPYFAYLTAKSIAKSLPRKYADVILTFFPSGGIVAYHLRRILGCERMVVIQHYPKQDNDSTVALIGVPNVTETAKYDLKPPRLHELLDGRPEPFIGRTISEGESIVVLIDALYCNEEVRWLLHESLPRYIERNKPNDNRTYYPVDIVGIACVFDFRTGSEATSKPGSLEGVVCSEGSKVSFVRVLEAAELSDLPESGREMCESNETRSAFHESASELGVDFDSSRGLPKLTEIRVNEQGKDRPNVGRRIFSAVEKSTAMWLLAEETRFLTEEKHYVKAEKHFTFYDKCENLFGDPHTVRELDKLVRDYVLGELDGKMDVILHPNHHNATLFAQLVATHARGDVLILPIHQAADSSTMPLADPAGRIGHQLEYKRHERYPRRLRALLVDDAMLSARSILEMYGLAITHKMDISGALVLLNRSTPNIELAVRALIPNFTWIYRVHLYAQQESNCPICARMDIHEELLKSSLFSELREYARDIIVKCEPTHLDIR